MTEGTFPKSDGDILYASEANSFKEHVIGFIEQEATIPSGTTWIQTGGSIYYSGTYPSIMSDHMTINTNSYAGITSDGRLQMRLRFSGTEFNEVTNTKDSPSQPTEGVNYVIPLTHIITSGTYHGWGGNFGSPFVISVETLAHHASIKLNNLCVTAI